MISLFKFFLESIQNLGQAIARGFTDFVDGLKKMFDVVAGAARFVWNVVLLVPTYYGIYIGIILTILIIFLLVHREAGGD